jgi:hypothetical protein
MEVAAETRRSGPTTGRGTARGARSSRVLGCGTVRVGLRCRPLSSGERLSREPSVVLFDDTKPTLVCLKNPWPREGEEEAHVFAFDELYGPLSTSEDVFADLGRPMVDGLFDGYNATIFAYGQTGSGKTHSMTGDGDDPGLTPRVAGAIFERAGHLREHSDCETQIEIFVSYFQVTRRRLWDTPRLVAPPQPSHHREGSPRLCPRMPVDALLAPSLLPSSPPPMPCDPSRDRPRDRSLSLSLSLVIGAQIYKEVLQDLLSTDTSAALQVRRDPREGPYVQGLSERPIDSVDGLNALIEQGNKKRAVASTLMNAASSRSHAMVVIRVEQETTFYEQARYKKRVSSRFNLVDLAGSERQAKSGAVDNTLAEAIAINQSLSALGNVINALTDPKAKGHIPFRASKLTHLLEPSLGGNANTAMLATISPTSSDYAETLQTLHYERRQTRSRSFSSCSRPRRRCWATSRRRLGRRARRWWSPSRMPGASLRGYARAGRCSARRRAFKGWATRAGRSRHARTP